MQYRIIPKQNEDTDFFTSPFGRLEKIFATKNAHVGQATLSLFSSKRFFLPTSKCSEEIGIFILFGYIVFCLLILSGCDYTLDRLSQVGKSPQLEEVHNPTLDRVARPLPWKKDNELMQPPLPPNKRYANSLWQPGARTFFRDQRARRVGDILKVIINVSDQANLDNKSQLTRNTADNSSAPNLWGYERKIRNFVPTAVDLNSLVNLTGANSHTGEGKINRTETISTQVAAMVTQILSNGNLVISGNQEIRVNDELREVTVAGIVRPEDISAENGINADQIAEARISYGGKGYLTNMQEPRIGEQIIDALSPF